jgi:hypothetical protein
MKIKAIMPIHDFNGRVLMPGETADVSASKGRAYIDSGRAIDLAEVKKRKVKRDNWPNDK